MALPSFSAGRCDRLRHYAIVLSVSTCPSFAFRPVKAFAVKQIGFIEDSSIPRQGPNDVATVGPETYIEIRSSLPLSASDDLPLHVLYPRIFRKISSARLNDLD